MQINEIMKELIEKDQRSKTEIGKEAGITFYALSDRLRNSNIGTLKAKEILDVLGYEMVIRPKRSSHRENEYVVE